MKKVFLFLLVALLSSFVIPDMKVVHNFSLKNVDGKIVSLSDYPEAKGFIIVFTCNHCPFAKLYSQRFNDLNAKYRSLGVPLIAVNSMDTLVYEEESFELMREKSDRDHFNFPYLLDAAQSVGKDFGASYTPQAFVIWKENNEWVIRYNGAMDDNGEHPELAKSFVDATLQELLQGKPVSVTEAKSIGCRIHYRK